MTGIVSLSGATTSQTLIPRPRDVVVYQNERPPLVVSGREAASSTHLMGKLTRLHPDRPQTLSYHSLQALQAYQQSAALFDTQTYSTASGIDEYA